MLTLKQKIEACSKCPLRTKLTEFEKPNFGVGSNKPKVMIVIDNNTSESSFLIDGLKLEYLEKNLKKYDIDKSDLYITPLVKCARRPTLKSFNECRDWLQEELEEFKPKAVIFISAFILTQFSEQKNCPIKVIATSSEIWYHISLNKLANSTAEDKKYTDVIFTKIKEYCA